MPLALHVTLIVVLIGFLALPSQRAILRDFFSPKENKDA